jgi:chemotaxis protein methyltransferase CheR
MIPNNRLTDHDFKRLSDFIQHHYGIKMPPSKKIMLESRLRSRLRDTGINSYSDYTNYLFSDEGMKNEVIHMIDVVSTNKTDFYREAVHFDFLITKILPELYKEKKSDSIKVWCAAASTGEEPYTLAITLEEFKSKNPVMDYSVYCTDISTQVLDKAIAGIYDLNRIENIPHTIKSKYFLRSKDRSNHSVRIIPELRKKLSFNRLNLIDDIYSTPNQFDVIFCRNVLIYFERPIQEKIINKLCQKLAPKGYLILGHSESTAGFSVPLKSMGSSIYQKQQP